MHNGVALLGAAALAGMLGASVDAAPKAAGVMTPEQVVAARRAAMMMSGATFGMVRAQADAEDLKRARFPARGLAQWAKAIPSMFPAGTNVAGTEALPPVWADRAGFETASQALVAATERLAAAAEAGDKAAYAAAIEQTDQACSACHDKYRKEREKR